MVRTTIYGRKERLYGHAGEATATTKQGTRVPKDRHVALFQRLKQHGRQGFGEMAAAVRHFVIVPTTRPHYR